MRALHIIKMFVLGIETSCDETSVSVVKDGRQILSNKVSSSLNLHKKYGGVVPEIASRAQLETIAQVADMALKEARIKLKDISLISVTSGPGLLGSLLVGISFAKALSLSLGIPLLGVNHLYGHLYASFLQPPRSQNIRKDRKDFCDVGENFVHFALAPFMALVVSGGHTSLFYVENFDKIKLLGATLDDAGGEAFDKVAKILGLGYPGGPIIERLGRNGNPQKIKFSCSNTKNPLDFSFSGIKTAVLYYVQHIAYSVERHTSKNITQYAIRNTQYADIAASFQETVIDTLIHKSLLACELKKVSRLVVGGGVAANNRLREKFYLEAKLRKLKVYFPAKELCQDNAAMVAGLGYKLFKKGYCSNLGLSVNSN